MDDDVEIDCSITMINKGEMTNERIMYRIIK